MGVSLVIEHAKNYNETDMSISTFFNSSEIAQIVQNALKINENSWDNSKEMIAVILKQILLYNNMNTTGIEIDVGQFHQAPENLNSNNPLYLSINLQQKTLTFGLKKWAFMEFCYMNVPLTFNSEQSLKTQASPDDNQIEQNFEKHVEINVPLLDTQSLIVSLCAGFDVIKWDTHFYFIQKLNTEPLKAAMNSQSVPEDMGIARFDTLNGQTVELTFGEIRDAIKTEHNRWFLPYYDEYCEFYFLSAL